ncbi:gliding motility protein RemB [Winogradskyella echinorum]|uniref:Gliding motility protein RemB n=1 Tax=Winogradskyella echinorum TaxID=538189 RepID=A0ABR6Y048_9FLAO|nr:gliding motility protein RemB [Winogradskyella echinorum]MBC3846132.1 gliding motility protein RemB [Winogradskyella echinorum]MBC5750480.1 gliding motility protein RemB [Winogradskyella echinorum]
MKRILLFAILSMSLLGFTQTPITYEKPPVFNECESEAIEQLKSCFNFTLNNFIYKNFDVPEIVNKESYRGDIQILFEINKEGEFKLIYVDAIYEELKVESKRVFDLLPKIKPATYNGEPTFAQYSISIAIPLTEPIRQQDEIVKVESDRNSKENLNTTLSNEFDTVEAKIKPYEKLEYTSELNIPFTHSYYARFDDEMNALGTNSHTAAKPFVYSDVAKYYDIKAEKENLAKDTDSWIGRKLYNEHLVSVQGKDYWFTVDPILDLQVGKDGEAEFSSTWNNTRGIFIQAGLGKHFNLSTSIYESQGRFADYFNTYAENIRAFGPDPALIPGRGIAKRFKDDSYDYPVAEAYLSYTPSKFFNVQFGHGKNFIGDGYRSLFQSDVASPYPFFKTNIEFWKIKYTSTWMSLRDVREDVIEDKTFRTKYMANHYLSWNVSKRLNIGLFESVMWQNSNDRGFDLNYLNPIIFFRAIEFQTGQGNGNAILGLSGKYKWNNKVNLYGQFLIDEFSVSDVTGGEKSWKNKLGFQIGAKYFNAFNLDNLLLQAEYNQVRPYTYAHNTVVLNYAHNNQPMAHLWGANFRELVLIGRYNYKRWFGDAKFIIGQRGFDFNTDEDSFNYGGNIYGDEDFRVADTGIKIGQGNKTNSFMTELQAGYLINPATNLKVFTNIIYRDFNPEAITPTTMKSNTLWFSFGVRTDLFNWYNDF